MTLFPPITWQLSQTFHPKADIPHMDSGMWLPPNMPSVFPTSIETTLCFKQPAVNQLSTMRTWSNQAGERHRKAPNMNNEHQPHTQCLWATHRGGSALGATVQVLRRWLSTIEQNEYIFPITDATQASHLKTVLVSALLGSPWRSPWHLSPQGCTAAPLSQGHGSAASASPGSLLKCIFSGWSQICLITNSKAWQTLF